MRFFPPSPQKENERLRSLLQVIQPGNDIDTPGQQASLVWLSLVPEEAGDGGGGYNK